MKPQRTIITIIVLVATGTLAWVFNDKIMVKNQTIGSNDRSNNIKTKPVTEKTKMTGEKLLFVDENNQIVQSDWNGKDKKIIYSDKDDALKIKMLGNFSRQSNEVLSILGDNDGVANQLAALKVDGSGKKEILNQNFGKPQSMALSEDGKSIAFIRFSNVEANYGYTLYVASRSGENAKKLTNSEQEIKNLIWNNDATSIYYLQTNDNKSDLNIIDLGSAQAMAVYSSNEIINSFTLDEPKIIYSTKNKIIQMDLNGKNGNKLTDFSGGPALNPYISSDQISLSYLIANNQGDNPDTANGKIYTIALKNKEGQELAQGIRVLGWVK